ncbi:MAG: RNA polymerase sigma factor [Maioricimonas sp. JB049]
MNNAQVAEDVAELQKKLKRWPQYSAAEREEILSETAFKYMLRLRTKTDPIRNPDHWLVRTAQFVGRNLRRPSREKTASPESVADRRFTSDAPDRENQCRPIDFSKSEAWTKLSDKQRRVLQMRYVEEMTVEDAASELGVPRSTAKSWISRSLLRLACDEYLRQAAGLPPESEAKSRPENN